MWRWLLAFLILCVPSFATKIGYLDLPRDRPIDQSTALYVKFALEEYRKQEVKCIVLHLNTPGGEVFAATSIAEALLEIDRDYHIPVVAYIDNWALSAGAMLAYSCRYIAVSEHALMGAAEPVMAGASGQMESAPEKINSALRAEMATLAKSYGRNPLIAEAMVDKDLIVVQRGETILRLRESSEIKKSDRVISAPAKLLTLDADQLLELHVANFSLERTEEVLTLPPFQEFKDPEFVKYSSWKIDFFALVGHPFVSSLLMMGLMIGVYMEIQHPGMVVPGVVAALCLGLIVLSQFAFQTIAWLEVLFVLAGIVFLICELWLFPGVFLCGILGVILFLIGLFGLLIPSWGTAHFSWNFSEWNLAAIQFLEQLEWFMASFFLCLVAIGIIARYLTPIVFKRAKLILHEDQEGSVAGLEKKDLPIIGDEGVAVSPLLPGGKAEINGRIYDVLSHSKFIERGEKVYVSKMQGAVIFVSKK